jgi:hypothetical protein
MSRNGQGVNLISCECRVFYSLDRNDREGESCAEMIGSTMRLLRMRLRISRTWSLSSGGMYVYPNAISLSI